MPNDIRKTISALAIFACASIAAPASAATLRDDTVSVSMVTDQNVFPTQSVLVGLGVDGEYFLSQYFDLDFNGNQFSIISTGSFSSMDNATTVTWTLSDLDFGVPLIGFNVLQSISAVTVNFVTANSVQFSYPDVAIPNGLYFVGEFITDTGETPLPAALPLFATVLGIGGFIARRRTQKLAA